MFPPSAAAIKFDKRGFDRGVLALPSDAAAIVFNAEQVLFMADSSTIGFHTSALTPDIIADVQATSRFRVIAGPLSAMLSACGEQLRVPVAEKLGTPWSILNTRVWTTPPASKLAGMYAKHRDGFPWQVFKIMIYFTPMDEAHGGLEIERTGSVLTALEGPAGSYVLFYNSALPHRGAAGKTEERACAEITLARTKQFDLTLHQAGLNAHFPLVPPAL